MTRHAVLFLALLPTGKATAPNCTATQDALVAYVAHVNALQEELRRVRNELHECRVQPRPMNEGEF